MQSKTRNNGAFAVLSTAVSDFSSGTFSEADVVRDSSGKFAPNATSVSTLVLDEPQPGTDPSKTGPFDGTEGLQRWQRDTAFAEGTLAKLEAEIDRQELKLATREFIGQLAEVEASDPSIRDLSTAPIWLDEDEGGRRAVSIGLGDGDPMFRSMRSGGTAILRFKEQFGVPGHEDDQIDLNKLRAAADPSFRASSGASRLSNIIGKRLFAVEGVTTARRRRARERRCALSPQVTWAGKSRRTAASMAWRRDARNASRSTPGGTRSPCPAHEVAS